MAETPLAFEIITFVVLALFFIVDLFVIGRRPHVPSTKECVQHIAFFVVMALIFGGCIWFFAGSKPAIEFYSGWLTEYSLSIDNLFVFVIIMSNFAVPKQIQKYVLSIGITIALIFRGIFILIGAALSSRFTWVFFLFGAFLIYTAVKLVLGGDEDEGWLSVDNPSTYATYALGGFINDDPQPAIVYGDANGDGSVDITDAMLVFYHVAKKEMMTDADLLKRCDVDKNGAVDISAAMRVFYFVAKKIDSVETDDSAS